jgi:hypothetical protein
VLRAADVWRLHPDEYEFLWRSILRTENESTYQRVDGYGVDCIAGGTAYQIYSHQGAPWAGVQAKFRNDLSAAQEALAAGALSFTRWVFISTFPFKEPAQAKWLAEKQAAALPLIVEAWGDEALLANPSRQTAVERMVGLIREAASAAVQVTQAGIVAIGHNAPGVAAIGHNAPGILIQHGPQRRPLVGVAYTTPDGHPSFLAWDGDIDHLKIEPPREVSDDALVAVHCAICGYESEPQQPIWARVQGTDQREVWEVDNAGGRRWKLRSARLKHVVCFLTVGPRRDPHCSAFCGRCGRTVSDGNFCSSCSTEVRGSVALRRCP